LRSSRRTDLLKVFRTLLEAYGPQNWWPVDEEYHARNGSDPREEIVIGAVLTQNTNWRNVEKALENLKRERALSLKAVREMPLSRLEELLRPCGYFRLKARRLKKVAQFLDPVDKVNRVSREELLGVEGVGRETADVILLYAGGRLHFVIDAYTRRIVWRVFRLAGSYEYLKRWFEEHLPRDLWVYREFHALLDEHGKRFCKKVPVCEGCPLIRVCTRP
jgi:endonuclease-3 related protein